MNLIWTDILSDVIAGIIIAAVVTVLGTLLGIIGGYALSFAEARVPYNNQRTKRFTRFMFSLLLAAIVILSPTKQDDARELAKMATSVPAVATTNVIVRRKSKKRDRQSLELQERLRQTQPHSPKQNQQATSPAGISATPPELSSRRSTPTDRYISPFPSLKKRRYASTPRQSTPKISRLFRNRNDAKKRR